VFKSDGAGILVPERWTLAANLEGEIGDLASNASGDAYLTLADSEATVTGRGWTLTEANGGTSGKAADAPWICETNFSSGTSSGTLIYDTTGNDLNYLMIAKIEISSAPSLDSPDNNACHFYSSDLSDTRVVAVNLCNGANTAGKYVYKNHLRSPMETGTRNNVTVGTGAHWIAVYCSPAVDTDRNSVERFDGSGSGLTEPTEDEITNNLLAATNVADMPTGGSSVDRPVRWYTYAISASYDSTLKIHECFIFEVA